MEHLQRIRQTLKWLIYNDIAKTDAEIAKLLGYTKSSFSQIVNGRVPMSDKFVSKLCSLDKNINAVWLQTGEGEMLSKQPSREEEPSMARVLEELAAQRSTLLAMLAEKDRHISQLLAMLNDKK